MFGDRDIQGDRYTQGRYIQVRLYQYQYPAQLLQTPKQHFGQCGIRHTAITDNGAQFTSDLFKTSPKKNKFNRITSSLYWSQSNGRADAALRSAKHILLTAEDVDLALLSVHNTPLPGHPFSPAQRLFGRALRSNLPQLASTLDASGSWRYDRKVDYVKRPAGSA